MNPWKVLSIESTVDLRAIKRAYAVQLKQHKPDVDPEGYQRVRDAFDLAKRIARDEASRQADMDASSTSDLHANESALDQPAVKEQTSEDETGISVVSSGTEPSTQETVHIIDDGSSNSTESSDAEPPPQETIYINNPEQASEEQPAHENENQANPIPDLINDLHEVLLEQGEIAAYSAFRDCLDRAELIPVDASKQFELHLMDYLNWWTEKQFHDENTQIPAGLIRQIVKHYSWHKQSSNHGNQFAFLENIYATTIGNSGEAYLQKIANGSLNASADHRSAAKLLLGKCRPLMFSLRALSPSRKKAISELLSNINNLKDGSFVFELNTDTIRWWIDAQSRYLVTGGMVMGAFFVTLPLYFFLMETLLGSPWIMNFLWPLLPIVLFIGSFVVSIYLIYKLFYYGVKVHIRLQDYLDTLSSLRKESYSAAVCLALILAMHFLAKVNESLAGLVITVLLIFFIGVYRIRTFILFLEFILLIISYDLIHGVLALEELTITQILLPLVAIHSVVFMASLAWLKYKKGVAQPTISQGKALLLSSPALILICAYSAVIN